MTYNSSNYSMCNVSAGSAGAANASACPFYVNDTEWPLEKIVSMIVPVFFGIIGLIGLMGNALVIIGKWISSTKHSKYSIAQMNGHADPFNQLEYFRSICAKVVTSNRFHISKIHETNFPISQWSQPTSKCDQQPIYWSLI